MPIGSVFLFRALLHVTQACRSDCLSWNLLHKRSPDGSSFRFDKSEDARWVVHHELSALLIANPSLD